MSDTFPINNKIKDNKLKKERHKDFIYKNIQINDFFLFKINNQKSERYRIVNIDNDFYYTENDEFVIDSNLSIIFDTNIIICREGNDFSKIIFDIFKILKDNNINNLNILNDTINEINNYNDSNDIEKKKYKESLLQKTSIYDKVLIYDNVIFQDKLFNLLLANERKKHNDLIDNKFLYTIWKNKIDLLVTDDKAIVRKSELLGIRNRVFRPLEFLKILLKKFDNVPDVEIKWYKIDYVSLREIDYKDVFFDSFRQYYKDFNEWFIKKQKMNQYCWVYKEVDKIKAFLLLKKENFNDLDNNIKNSFQNEQQILKISTFKSISEIKFGERFLYIIFNYALKNKIKIIYTTFYDDDNNVDIKKYKKLISKWGFVNTYNTNSKKEVVYIKRLNNYNELEKPIFNYPIQKNDYKIWILPIKYHYHLDLFADIEMIDDDSNSFLSNKKNYNYAIKKVYLCDPFGVLHKEYKLGDKLIIYKMGPEGTIKKYSSSITGEAILNGVEIVDLNSEKLKNVMSKSIYNEESLKKDYGNLKKIAIVEFLYLKKYDYPILNCYLKEKYEIQDFRIFSSVSKEQYCKIVKDMTKYYENNITNKTRIC